jgi:hypothetical protein
MSKPTRKQRQRHDPFNDFEIEEQSQPAPVPTSVVVADDLAETISGIELLSPSKMLPDRFQPRPLLPLDIATRFFGGEIDCYQAARAWMKQASADKGMQKQIDQLLSMADTFDEHGQIKAITGSFVPNSNGTYIFQIETGERRFWAACLKYVKSKLKKEPNLRVEVVDHPSRYRQVIENRHAEPPSAVAQAREIAAILLENLLNLLYLPTPILEIANRYDMPERVLREILSHPEGDWDSLVSMVIEEGLTAEEVALVQHSDSKKTKSGTKKKRILPAQSAIRGLRTFARAVSKVDQKTQGDLLDELADEMMVKGEAHTVLQLIEELGTLLRARVERS